MPSKGSIIDKEFKKDLSSPQLKRLLRRAHLPKDYPTLTPKNKEKARKSVLTSWFDPDLPHILVTNVENLVAALFLWVEFFYKPAGVNFGRYYFDDPLNKYDMVRNCMREPKDITGPTKTVMTSTRRLGKTETFVYQLMPMMVICRPFTTILLSELNATRTGEELDKIKIQVEENERIHSDFGAEGVLFPSSGRQGRWSSKHLKFIHHYGSEIMGHSLGSAQRGRGPLFGVIDDPEDEDNTYDVAWRKWFFSKLLGVYVHMFHHGGKLLWIGTPIHKLSCLSVAMRGKVYSEEDDSEEGIHDKRFDDFYRVKSPLIVKDEKGEWKSMQPERMNIEQFLRRMEIDPIHTRAEVLCEPVTPGQRAFRYDEHKHGFMHCVGEDREEYFLDLLTGDNRPWRDFVSELRVFSAGDLADGSSTDDDEGALAYIGVDSRGVIYVLDMFVKKCQAEVLVEMSAALGLLWKCEAHAWERTSFQVIVNRHIRRYYDELRQKGQMIPAFAEVDNAKKNKVRRILTMIPLFGNYEIRFLQFEPIEDKDGKIHTPVDYERRDSYEKLIDQVREFTDEGIRGADDAIDALEMSIRITGDARGQVIVEEDETSVEAVLEKWRKVGLNFDKSRVPRDLWTEEMLQESLGIPDDRRAQRYLRGVIPYV